MSYYKSQDELQALATQYEDLDKHITRMAFGDHPFYGDPFNCQDTENDKFDFIQSVCGNFNMMISPSGRINSIEDKIQNIRYEWDKEK